jgi:hypothetical protein
MSWRFVHLDIHDLKVNSFGVSAIYSVQYGPVGYYFSFCCCQLVLLKSISFPLVLAWGIGVLKRERLHET